MGVYAGSQSKMLLGCDKVVPNPKRSLAPPRIQLPKASPDCELSSRHSARRGQPPLVSRFSSSFFHFSCPQAQANLRCVRAHPASFRRVRVRAAAGRRAPATWLAHGWRVFIRSSMRRPRAEHDGPQRQRLETGSTHVRQLSAHMVTSVCVRGAPPHFRSEGNRSGFFVARGLSLSLSGARCAEIL